MPDGKPGRQKLLEPDIVLWSVALRAKMPVLIKLVFGDEISGLVVRFGLYSVSIKTDDGRELLVFKSSIATAALMQAA